MDTGKLRFRKQFHIFLHFYFLLFTCVCFSQKLAPGAPGKDAQWATAGKQAIGTSASLESKVWFTLANGAMTEVYYPDVTVANVHKLEFVVVNPKTHKVETETEDAIHQIKVLRPDSMTFQQINTAKSGEWKITKTYTTDVERDSVLIDVQFETKNKNLNLYVYYDPSLANTGMGDRAYSPLAAIETEAERVNNGKKTLKKEKINSGLGADKAEYATALLFSSNISELNNGFYGVSDGLEQLRRFGKILHPYSNATDGNVVQMAKILNPQKFTVVLGCAKDDNYNILTAAGNAAKSLKKGFAKAQAEYEKSWSDYVKTLPKVDTKYQAQFNMAAMVLKAQEDKTVRGANVASLTILWGGGKNANKDIGGGYHLVWSRDLYEVVTAYMALGDTVAANRALDFLFNIQQRTDGSFPQNSWLDGRNGWGGLQMDEVGYPLIMAYQLKRFDRETYQNHVKRAADFIVKNGPKTPQERWEEKGGYSPSTIAAEIAGLVCAAEIAKQNGDNESANLWLKTADDWQANIDKWTATTNGKYGDGNYYVRLTANGKPDAGEKIELSNSSGAFPENEIVDAGFLELVRLGIKSPDDPLILKSVKVVDQVLKVNTPNGESFYRYNHDGYGEQPDGRRWNFDGTYSGTGRLWALLAGERGQYELAVSDFYRNQIKVNRNITEGEFAFSQKVQAMKRLETMANFANEGLMIPEQIWDKAETPKNIDKQFVPELKFGEGTGSATPLAWSMAQFIRLAVNLKEGRNLDTPKVVYDRYVLGKIVNTFVDNQGPISNYEVNLPIETRNIAALLALQPGVSPDGRTDQANVTLDSVDVNETNGTKGNIIKEYKPNPNELPEFRVYTNNLRVEHPKINKNEATFLYFGTAKNVEIVGDFTGWQSKGLKFKLRQGEEDKGSRSLELTLPFAPTARVEYKLIVDGQWITDRFNPNKVDNGVGGENSFFTMPDYKPTIWDKEIKGFEPSLETIEIDSKVYNEKRKLQVFALTLDSTEPNYQPVLYLQDGGDYVKRGKVLEIFQNLLSAKKIKPFIMVFLDPKDRMKEYWANDDYAKFLAEEVVPMIDSKYNTIKSREGRAVMGASLGGITAVHVGLKYPNIFSRIGGQSSSFWIDNERVVKDLEKLDGKTKFKFYFDDGTLEGVEDSRKVVKILQAKNFDVTYIESEAGHNWTAWRDRLADAFIAIWK